MKQIAEIKRNREWEGKFMLFEEMLRDEKEEGKQAMSQLIELLFKQNRMDDILKVSQNADYREKLLKEFHLDN